MNCVISGIIGISLLTASLFCMSVSKTQHDLLKNVFSDELDKKYDEIVKERRNLYLQGLILGMGLASIWLVMNRKLLGKNRFYYISIFFSVSLLTALLYYMLMPKSDYMLNHLKSPEENKAWLNMYRTMQSRYLYGLLLGTIAAIPIANAFCCYGF